MGLCKCPKRKVTNLFCFEHDVNVCEDCLVTDHERCIVQSYVQWLQDSDYNPICILCKNLLKDDATVRLACYDVFHWSCIDKYASSLPVNTAPAGYQCPKCKECIFPPSNIVSPVVDVLRKKLESVEWSRAGLGQSLLKIDDNLDINDEEETQEETVIKKSNNEDESNGFVIVSEQQNQQTKKVDNKENSSTISEAENVQQNQRLSKKTEFSNNEIVTPLLAQENILSHHNRENKEMRKTLEPTNDSSLGVILNINNLEDRDTGEYKYQRRPVFEWLGRWMKSRQISSNVRMTRQKRYLFIIIVIFIAFFTLILVMTRLGNLSTEDDPAFDPLNNPNIHVQ